MLGLSAQEGSGDRSVLCLFGGLQHRLADQLLTNLRHAWLWEASVEEAARLGTHSGWSAGAAILRCPTERLLRLSDSDLKIAVDSYGLA